MDGSGSLSDYRIVQRLSQGSFGSVFKIVRESDGREFVLKRVPMVDMDAAARAQTKLEADLMRQLHHPHVVPYRDAFIFNNEDLCIVMDWFGGGDLSKYTNSGRPTLTERQVMLRFVEIALALHYLHSHRIVHRDLKPQNIFEHATTGEVAVGDFGVAKLLEAAKPGVAPSGTPLYMAPELTRGEPFSFKSDVWALGCVTYELLCGRHPFHATDISGLVINVARGEYSPIPSHFSVDVARLVERMLERDPRRRPNIDEILMTPFVKAHLHTYLAVRIPTEAPTSQGEVMLRSQMEVLGVLDSVIDVDAELEKTRTSFAPAGPARRGLVVGRGRGRGAGAGIAPPAIKRGRGAGAAAKSVRVVVNAHQLSDEDQDEDETVYRAGAYAGGGGALQRDSDAGGGGDGAAWGGGGGAAYHEAQLGRNRVAEGKARSHFAAAAAQNAGGIPRTIGASITPLNAIETPALGHDADFYAPPSQQQLQQQHQPQHQQTHNVIAGRRFVGSEAPAAPGIVFGGELELERQRKRQYEEQLYSACRERDEAFIKAKLAKQHMLYGSPQRSVSEVVALARTPSPTKGYFDVGPSPPQHQYQPTQPAYDFYGSPAAQQDATSVRSSVKELEEEVLRYRRLVADQMRQIAELRSLAQTQPNGGNGGHGAANATPPRSSYFGANMNYTSPAKPSAAPAGGAINYSNNNNNPQRRRAELRHICTAALGEQTFARVYEYYSLHPIAQRSAAEVKRIVQNASAWHVLPLVEELLGIDRQLSGRAAYYQ